MPQSRGPVGKFLLIFCLLLLSSSFTNSAKAAIGDPLLNNMKPVELKFFNNGKTQFNRVWGMKEGVGPVLTDGACQRCHNQGALGGSSARLLTFFGKINPDLTFDPLDGTGASGQNEGGLLLQARSNQAFLKSCPQGGEVLPADANAVENRIAMATFGFGLIDALADQTLIDQAAFELQNYQADGIHGMAGTVPTYYSAAPHTIGRFGKKAQMANLIEMAAFAFAHDFGVTNPLFQNEDLPQGQPIDLRCTQNVMVPNNSNTGSGGNGMFPLSHFMRYLAPPDPVPCPVGANCAQGQAVFSAIGCDKCHKQSYTTPANVVVQTDTSGTPLQSIALSNIQINLYSDLLLHDLGNADKGVIPAGYVNTGVASQSQWRTTPLWGLHYRTNLMHSGRSTTIDAAIRAHSDGSTGEAVSVTNNYNALSASDEQALLDFLGTL
jgi:CxxC motif-containing protein (DUF1111 family)